MKQVVIIHGATTFSTYEKYLDYLRTKTIDPERMKYKPTWRESLQSELGDTYEVFNPKMPNTTNAKYNEWKLWFDRIVKVLSDDCILIGHSMGSIFLAKYLSENKLPIKVTATILVAAPYDDESDEDLGDFKLKSMKPLFSQQAGKVTFFNGSDDPVVSIKEVNKYREHLLDAEYIVASAPDHFMRPSFPEIVQKILGL